MEFSKVMKQISNYSNSDVYSDNSKSDSYEKDFERCSKLDDCLEFGEEEYDILSKSR